MKVRLSAVVEDYKRGMVEAANATRTVGSEAERLAQTRQSMQMLGGAGVAMGAALSAGIGVAVAKFAEFDQAMSFVAATGEDARGSIDALRQAALDAGASTVFSATEAANAIEGMAKAGISATDILGGGLKGALDLAAAGGLGVAEASGIAATTMQQFSLEGTDASHVADLLAAGAGKAMGDVSDMSEAMKQSGLVANQFGLSVEESTGTLAAFAQAGLLGSDAGTSFRTMLLRLANPTGEAAALMKDLKINAYDAGGQFVGMAGLAGQLEQGMSGLTEEQKNANLAIIFGQDAIRGANVLLKEGKSGIEGWTEAVDDQGYAAETAAIRLDNLAGDWEKLTGAMDSAFISMGEGANGPIRDVLQGLTELVDGFNGLPDWAKQSALGVAVLTAGIGLVGGAALLAIPKIIEFQIAMQTLGITGASTRAGLARLATFLTGPWGIALVGAAAGVVALQMATDSLKTSTEEFQNVIRNAESVGDLFDAADSALPWLSRLKEATSDAEAFRQKLDVIAGNDFLRGLDRSASQLKNSLADIGIELAKTAQTDLPAAQNAFRLLATEMDLSKSEQQDLLNSMGDYKKALQAQATERDINISTMSEAENAQALLNLAMGEAPDPAREATDAYKAEADEVERLDAELSQLIDSINKANGVGQDAVATNAAYQSALAGISEEIANQKAAYKETHGTLEGFTVSLDESTAAGSANAAMLGDVAGKAQDAAAAQFEQDKATMSSKEAADKYAATLAAQRQAFIDSAVAAGFNKDEVVKLADKVFALPPEKAIKILADTGSATWAIDNLINSYNGRVIRLRAAIDRGAANQELAGIVGVGMLPHAAGALYGPGGVKEFAGGGFEPGIYPYTPGGIHKFAEEYGEAYISMDPRRRERSKGVLVETAQQFGMLSSGGTPGPVQVSLAGAQMTLLVDGNPVRAVVQEQIVSYDAARERSTRGGWSGQ